MYGQMGQTDTFLAVKGQMGLDRPVCPCIAAQALLRKRKNVIWQAIITTAFQMTDFADYCCTYLSLARHLPLTITNSRSFQSFGSGYLDVGPNLG